MAVYHISLAFVQSSDNALDPFVENVITKMTGNVNFPTPDPALADISTALGTFRTAVAAMQQGRPEDTIARNNARGALIALLRELVLYIEKIAKGDRAILMSSGFVVISSDHPPVFLSKPAIKGIDFGSPGSVILHCGGMGSATFLKVQYRSGGGNWVDGITSTQARNVTVPGLVSGTTYDFRVQLGAGKHNFSDWSDPVSHMAP